MPSVSEAALLGSAEDRETRAQPQPEPVSERQLAAGAGEEERPAGTAADEHACQLSGLELIPGTEWR